MKNLAIIGHGPAPVGKGYGALIDSMDCVIRFHTCGNQDLTDYGTRFDYGILPGPWIDRAIKEIERVPCIGWLVYFLHNQRRPKTAPLFIEDKFVLTEEVYITKLFSDMDLPPSRGLCSIALAAKLLKPENIWLVGFDSILEGIVMQYHPSHVEKYGAMPEEYIGRAINKRHNFRDERARLKYIAQTTGISIKDIADYSARLVNAV